MSTTSQVWEEKTVSKMGRFAVVLSISINKASATDLVDLRVNRQYVVNYKQYLRWRIKTS